MREVIPFRREELDTQLFYPKFRGVKLARYRYPISSRENLQRLYARDNPLWIPRYRAEWERIDLSINPDNIARGPMGGPDMFGVMWEFDPVSRGSMVRPGRPLFTDANEWTEHLCMPDIDRWDWSGFAERERPERVTGQFRRLVIMNGLFERLISLMDFTNAAVALVDEDQTEAVGALFHALCDMYEHIIRNAKRYLDIDMVTFHDDWGTQRSPIFSQETCREMLMPYMKRLTACAHDNGVYFEHHCCGNVEALLPIMIESGVDSWEGQENANDKAEMIRRYGRQLLIYISPPDVQDVPEERLFDTAQAFMAQFPAGTPMLFAMSESNQRLDKALYEISRKHLTAR